MRTSISMSRNARTGRRSDVTAGTRISVFWDLDKKWYDAEVLDCDPATGTCKVLYTDGEREEFELKQVKHRILWNGKLRERDKLADERVSSRKQLEYIVKTLLDMEDRLPPRGVLNNKKKWWQAWHSRVASAGKSGNLRELVRGTVEIAFQMKDNVSTSWWKSQKFDWQKEVLLARTNGELASHVSELLTKAVDWAVARQLFSSNDSENDHSDSADVIPQDDTGEDLVNASWSPDQEKKPLDTPHCFPSGSVRAVERFYSPKSRTLRQVMGKEKKSPRPIRARPADTGGLKELQSLAVQVVRRSKRKLVGDESTDLASVDSPTDNSFGADQTASLDMPSSVKRRKDVNSDDLRDRQPVSRQVETISIPTAAQGDLCSTEGITEKLSRQKVYSLMSFELEKPSLRKVEPVDDSAVKRSKLSEEPGQCDVAEVFNLPGGGIGEERALETDEKQETFISGLRKSGRKRTRIGSRLEGFCELNKVDENVGDKLLESMVAQEPCHLKGPVLEEASSRSRVRRTRRCAIKSCFGNEDREVLKGGKLTNVCGRMLSTDASSPGTNCSGSSGTDDSSEDYRVEADEDICEYLEHENSWGERFPHERPDFEDENLSIQLKARRACLEPSFGRPLRSQNLITGEEQCSICGFAGADEFMLLCDEDGCNCALHTFCLAPPMQSIPEGEWLCPHCSYEKANTLGFRRRTKRCSGETYPSKEIGSIIGRRKIFLSDEGKSSGNSVMQYLVKWDLLSHQHDTWVPEDWLLFKENRMVVGFRRKYPLSDQSTDSSFDERRPEWLLVDRVIGCRYQDAIVHPSQLALRLSNEQVRKQLEFLVKWRALDHKSATWEKGTETEETRKAISEYIERHERADVGKRGDEVILTAASIMRQPDYLQGGMMFGFQLHGLNWLLNNFQQGRSVILADEMGLGKTIQAVAFIACIRHERLSSSPALVITPKSTLPGWQQEFQRWSPGLNTVIYQGDKENRALIREHEFYTASKKPLFDVLVTSYELATCDDFLLRRFHWAALLVDEGHRVKNVRSKLGILLKRHAADFRLLLTGTPVQNTLKELFALLQFLDPTEFPDPENSARDFMEVDTHGNTGSDVEAVQEQVSRIHDLLRPRVMALRSTSWGRMSKMTVSEKNVNDPT